MMVPMYATAGFEAYGHSPAFTSRRCLHDFSPRIRRKPARRGVHVFDGEVLFQFRPSGSGLETGIR